ncbi:DMT family transporter [Suttonella ornithocola]|uniref:Predicted permease, DMT superfamily n=1 Tax=Suttonella ornithocola TaxID=279832 RepID=A0A380MX44_9GAMM|nr:DMT family transporter [Suttonella ornithocola]SUO97129.1 Predicted permease, DMT superfamily [Suttonella ornithocola]
MDAKAKNDTPAIIGLLIGCIVFGLGSLIVAFVPINSYAIAFWRLLLACFVFVGIFLFRHQSLPGHPKALFFTCLAGIFFAFDLSLWHESIHAVGPGISTLLNSLQIFFITAIGFFFFQERPNRLQLLSLNIAILGVALIASPEFAHNQRAAWGFISGVLSGGALAASMSAVRKVHEYEPTPIIPLMLLFNLSGTIILFPIALLADGAFFPSTLSSLFWTSVYGIVMQCGAWALVVFAIPRLSLALTGLILLSEPVAAIIIDATLLAKPITAIQWLGCGLTLISIYLGTLRRNTI